MTLQSQAYNNSDTILSYGASGDDSATDQNLPGATYDPQSPFDYPNFAEPEPTETEIQRDEEEERIDAIERASRFQPNLRE